MTAVPDVFQKLYVIKFDLQHLAIMFVDLANFLLVCNAPRMGAAGGAHGKLKHLVDHGVSCQT
jgi:hypothetical protein